MDELQYQKANWRLKIREERVRLAKEFKTRTVGYLVTAFGLVAGLAWNEAIKALITVFFPSVGADIVAKFGYAIIVTIFIVIISFYLMRLIQQEEPKK